MGARAGLAGDAGAHRAQRLLQAEAAGVHPALGLRGDLDEVAALHQLSLPTGLGRFREALPGERGLMGGCWSESRDPQSCLSTRCDSGQG